jgi:hypothetical protein
MISFGAVPLMVKQDGDHSNCPFSFFYGFTVRRSTRKNVSLRKASWHDFSSTVLQRRRKQPTNMADKSMLLEEWDRIPQEWINELILKQEHWVHVLIERPVVGGQLLIKG